MAQVGHHIPHHPPHSAIMEGHGNATQFNFCLGRRLGYRERLLHVPRGLARPPRPVAGEGGGAMEDAA